MLYEVEAKLTLEWNLFKDFPVCESQDQSITIDLTSVKPTSVGSFSETTYVADSQKSFFNGVGRGSHR